MTKYCKKCGILIGKNSVSLLCKKCYKQEWDEIHSKERQEYNRDWNKTNQEYRRHYNLNWCKNHREQRVESKRQSLLKCKKNSLWRFKDGIRHNIKDAVAHRTNYSFIKEKTTEDILGCTLDYFINYISSLFQENMSWDNYGEWHLDHIKPLALASSKEEVYILCHYSNYQPLWALDNLRKGANYGN